MPLKITAQVLFSRNNFIALRLRTSPCVAWQAKAFDMIRIENISNTTVISFTSGNKLNVSVTQQVKTDILEAITGQSRVVLNLDGISYIDSTGFGMLLSVLRHYKSNGAALMLCCLSPEVQELIKLLQLQNIFDIRGSVDECLA